MLKPLQNPLPRPVESVHADLLDADHRSANQHINQHSKSLFHRLNPLRLFQRAAIDNLEQPDQSDPLPATVAHTVDLVDLTVTLTDEDCEALLASGHQALKQGDFTRAVTYYRQVQQQHPDREEVYQYLAEALMQQGELAEAAQCYRQAIAVAQAPAPSANRSQDLSQDLIVEVPKPIGRVIRLQSTSTSQTASLTVSPANTPVSPTTRPNDCNSPSQPANPARKSREIPWFEQVSFYLQQAGVHCNNGNWATATALCQQALEQLEPEAFTAFLLLGRSLQQQTEFDQAEQAYRKALALQPTAEVYARLGSLAAEQQQFNLAVQHYQQAIQLDTSFAGAYWQLAEVLQQLDQEEASLTCWYQTFQLQPDWANASEYCQLADRLLHLGKLTAAQHCYQRAIERQALPEAYLGLGLALQRQGQPEAAKGYYSQAMQQAQQPQLWQQLGDAWIQIKQWSEALVCYQRLLQLSPCLEAMVGIQRCSMELEQWHTALVPSQKLVELQPQVAQHWHHLGDVLSRLQRWAEAVPAYQQAVELRSDFAWSYNNLADAYLQLQQWQQAASTYQMALRLNPNFAWSHYNCGQALDHLEDWDGAIACYRTALQLQPDLPYVSEHLADALQQRAMSDRSHAFAFYQQAIQQAPANLENYHKAIELQPDKIELYLQLSEVLVQQKQWDEALVCCQIARQLQPDNLEIVQKLKQLLQQRNAMRQPHSGDDSDYEQWIKQNTLEATELQQMSATNFAYRPLISILMPVYNPPEAYLRAAIQSVLEQAYANWELCIADDVSEFEIQLILHEYAALDPRIKLVFREENGHISAASNSALAAATGEFVALLDHDDVLAPEALYEVVALLNQHPQADVIYSDEDKLNEQGQRFQPFFKPDWCPDSFLSRMYTCHLGVYRRKLMQAIGGFRIGYEGSQDYDLVLRLTEQTEQIFHIPKVLYHWRSHAASTASQPKQKTYAEEAAKLALTDACQRRGEPLQRIETKPGLQGVYIPRYQINAHKPVSIIIPTRNLGTVLDRCLASIFEQSSYPNYEVLLIDNGSNEAETLEIIGKWQRQESQRFRSCYLDIPFNYSKINNYAVQRTSADYLLFLNNDTEVITPDWIEAMVEQAQRPSIGAVGAKLLYPDQTIQHAGVVLGIGGIAGHSHKYYAANDRGYLSQLVSLNNYSAVTAACLMCRRTVFEQAGGFDESLAVAFNDVDFCLKLGQFGYRNIYLPHVQLYHHESKSRGIENTLEKQRRFRRELEVMKLRWGDLLQHDPCYSPHLSLEREDYSLRVADSTSHQSTPTELNVELDDIELNNVA